MKKLNLFVVLLFLSNFQIFSNDNLIQNKLEIIGKVDISFETDDIYFYFLNNLLYFVPSCQDVTADSLLYIFSYSIQDKKLDSILVKFPTEHLYWKMLIPERIRKEKDIKEKYYDVFYKFAVKSFAVSNKYFIIGGRYRFLVFSKNNFNFLYAVKSEKIYGHEDEFCFNNLKIMGDTLLGYRCHTYDAGGFCGFSKFANDAGDSQLVSTAIMKYDLKNKKTINFKIIYPEPKGLGFLNFAPRQNIDCNGNYYIISDITEYNLYLYDTDWNLVDKISLNHKNWIQDKNLPDRKTVALAYKEHPKNSIRLMDPFTHSTSLSHNIMFQNSETILVSWSVPTGDKKNRYKFYFDEYKIINGKLKLTNTFEEAKLDKNSEKTFIESGASALYMPRKYYLFDNYLVSTSNDTPYDIFSKEIQNMSLKNYYQKVDDYFIDNSTKTSILIYKFK